MLKLKVFAGKCFQDCENDFNRWVKEHDGAMIVNLSFHNGENWREITVLWSEKPEDPRITVPQPVIGHRPQ